MFTYPKVLRQKDLKKISKYPCSDEIKDAYTKYLTNYSFNEFAEFCKDNPESLEDKIYKFTDLQLEKFEPNSLIWISHVLINFMIYFNVNLDYENYYDAYASAIQMTVLSLAMKILLDKITFGEANIPEHCTECFAKFFDRCPDFRFNLKKDCELAYKSFNNEFAFTSDEFYQKVQTHFSECSYQ